MLLLWKRNGGGSGASGHDRERISDPGATTRFTGTASDATFAYGVFGVVLALGLTFVLAGVWQIVYGRRNKKIVFVALALVAVFYALGLYARGRP